MPAVSRKLLTRQNVLRLAWGLYLFSLALPTPFEDRGYVPAGSHMVLFALYVLYGYFLPGWLGFTMCLSLASNILMWLTPLLRHKERLSWRWQGLLFGAVAVNLTPMFLVLHRSTRLAAYIAWLAAFILVALAFAFLPPGPRSLEVERPRTRPVGGYWDR